MKDLCAGIRRFVMVKKQKSFSAVQSVLTSGTMTTENTLFLILVPMESLGFWFHSSQIAQIVVG